VQLLKNFICGCYVKLINRRKDQLVDSFPVMTDNKILCLGVGDGSLALRIANKVNTKNISGLEIDLSYYDKGKKIDLIQSDLNEQFPFQDETFDLVFSDQVIEHVINVDNFIEETYRVLKPGGLVVVCTENLCAWHNVLSLIFGFQAFAQTISVKHGVGNPFSVRDAKANRGKSKHWFHIQIFTLYGLKKLLIKNNFEIGRCWGTGYFPFPLSIGRLFEVIDPGHSYFIGIRARKPQN